MARRFQFSLRTIFALTTLAAIGCLVLPPIFAEIHKRFLARPQLVQEPIFLTEAELAPIINAQSQIVLVPFVEQAETVRRQTAPSKYPPSPQSGTQD